MRKSELYSLIIAGLAFAIGAYFYPQLPLEVATHWNTYGEADGFLPKDAGIFLFPVASLLTIAMFHLIPKIDPLKRNINKFRKYVDSFLVVLNLFLFYLFLLVLYWNLGYQFNMSQAIVPAFGILLYYLGILTENSKRNWFIGIRTPWTLSSDRVWNKTHKLGGNLFKIAGAIALFGALFPDYSFILFVVPLFVIIIFVTIYSYMEFHKTKRKRGKK